MDDNTGGSGPSIDLQRDNEQDTERQVDAIAYAIAPSLIFNAVALPPNLPDHLLNALITKAGQDREAAMEAGFIMSSNEQLIDGKTPQERDKERDDKAVSYAALMMEELDERRQREEASYQEWRQTRHTYAGKAMGGEDWDRMMNWFRDPANAADWEDAMIAETGQSRNEVRETGGKMKRFYHLMEKDARGTMSKDERSEFDKLNADKDVKRGVEIQQEIQGLQNSRTTKLSAGNENSLDGSQSARTKSFASTFSDEPTLSTINNVPALTSLYQEAANGKPKVSPPEPSASPGLPPAQIVHANPDNMFG